MRADVFPFVAPRHLPQPPDMGDLRAAGEECASITSSPTLAQRVATSHRFLSERHCLCSADLMTNLSPGVSGHGGCLGCTAAGNACSQTSSEWRGWFWGLRPEGAGAVLRVQPPCSHPAPSPTPCSPALGAGLSSHQRGLVLSFSLPPLTANPSQKKLLLGECGFHRTLFCRQCQGRCEVTWG